ncbi:MAG: ABC transporter permease [Ilumatobacteraceae bacterium]
MIPVVEGTAQIVGADGEPIGGNGPPTIGTNWVEMDRNPYVLLDGRPPVGAGEVVLDSGTADDGDLGVGDRTTVRVPAPIDVTVVGVAELRSGEQMGGVTFTWFDTDTAQDLLLGDADALYAVDLQAEPGVGDEELRAAIESSLPSDLEALTRQELIDEEMAAIEADFLGFFTTFLLAFAGVALLVATFSIHNTFAIVVAQRTRETALLRALSASRGQVLAGVGAEALVIGAVAATVGLGAGVGLAIGLNAILTALGAGVPTAGLGMTVGVAVLALAVGVVVTLVAAIAPALRASKVAPIAALRESAIDESGSSTVRAALGTAVTAAGVAGLVFSTDIGSSPLQVAALEWTGGVRRPHPARTGGRSRAGGRGDRHADRRRAQPELVFARQRDAEPEAHVGDRLGADDQDRGRGTVRLARDVDQGLARRPRRRSFGGDLVISRRASRAPG